jgi:V/A-type H+-transporting ATPase subunit E
MSGLDKISETILKEAQEKADGIIAQARAKAQEIEKDAAARTDDYTRRYAGKIKRETQAVAERYASDNRQRRKREILRTRSMVINDTVQKAKAKLVSLPDGEYFDFLRKVCVRNAQSGEGRLYVAGRDSGRLPGDFIDKCNAGISGGSVKLAGSADTIENGFIIMYGRIEQNCSVDSIFESNNNLLLDTVNACLQEQA